jgi:hypothetical protein
MSLKQAFLDICGGGIKPHPESFNDHVLYEFGVAIAHYSGWKLNAARDCASAAETLHFLSRCHVDAYLQIDAYDDSADCRYRTAPAVLLPAFCQISPTEISFGQCSVSGSTTKYHLDPIALVNRRGTPLRSSPERINTCQDCVSEVVAGTLLALPCFDKISVEGFITQSFFTFTSTVNEANLAYIRALQKQLRAIIRQTKKFLRHLTFIPSMFLSFEDFFLTHGEPRPPDSTAQHGLRRLVLA